MSYVSSPTGYYAVDGLVLELVLSKLDGKSNVDCESLCRENTKCKGFSYAKDIKQCILSSEDYNSYTNPVYNFYERRGLPHRAVKVPAVPTKGQALGPLSSSATEANWNIEKALTTAKLRVADAIHANKLSSEDFVTAERQVEAVQNQTQKVSAAAEEELHAHTAKFEIEEDKRERAKSSSFERLLDLRYEASKEKDRLEDARASPGQGGFRKGRGDILEGGNDVE